MKKMMREILFRGKRVDTGGWVCGYLVRHPSSVHIGYDFNPWYIHVPPADPDDNGGVYNTDPATVGQYTGLTDKNGVKIFEGDIIQGPGARAKPDNFVVLWDAKICSFTAGQGKRMWPALNQATVRNYEVIGNAHDTPELPGMEG